MISVPIKKQVETRPSNQCENTGSFISLIKEKERKPNILIKIFTNIGCVHNFQIWKALNVHVSLYKMQI